MALVCRQHVFASRRQSISAHLPTAGLPAAVHTPTALFPLPVVRVFVVGERPLLPLG